MAVFARGLLNRLFTRVYLPDHADALAADPLLGVAAGRTGATPWSPSSMAAGCDFDVTHCRARTRPCSSSYPGPLTA